MANQEHLDILKQGVEVWNQWRKAHPDILQPDLQGADLSQAYFMYAHLEGAHLRYVHLEGAHLSGAYLEKADLSGAHLEKANLIEAHLEGANLSNANLNSTFLDGANLSGANLSGSFLEKVDLSGANLSGANLSDAILREANLLGAYLNDANLDKANLSKAYISESEKDQLRGKGAIGLYDALEVVGVGRDEIAEVFPSTTTPNPSVSKKTLGVAQASSSTIRIRITEEPLTAQNLTTIISALNELHTKCWLIQQDRFSDLINYAQTHDIRFTKEANLTIGKLNASKLIMRPERVTEERLAPYLEQRDCRYDEGPLQES